MNFPCDKNLKSCSTYGKSSIPKGWSMEGSGKPATESIKKAKIWQTTGKKRARQEQQAKRKEKTEFCTKKKLSTKDEEDTFGFMSTKRAPISRFPLCELVGSQRGQKATQKLFFL